MTFTAGYKTSGADKKPVSPFGSNGNGNNGGGLSVDFLEGLLGDSNAPSIAREFVHPGDKPDELLMRTVFKDEAQVNAAAEYLAYCVRYKYDQGIKRLMYKMAGNCSIDGMRIKELMMALTQRVVPELYTKSKRTYVTDNHSNDDNKGP
jgi:hypothetical protein